MTYLFTNIKVSNIPFVSPFHIPLQHIFDFLVGTWHCPSFSVGTFFPLAAAGRFERQFLSCISPFPLEKTVLALFLSDKAIISVLFASIW